MVSGPADAHAMLSLHPIQVCRILVFLNKPRQRSHRRSHVTRVKLVYCTPHRRGTGDRVGSRGVGVCQLQRRLWGGRAQPQPGRLRQGLKHARHLRRRHLGEAAVHPAWRVVLLHQDGAHPLGKVGRLPHKVVRHAVLHLEALRDGHAPAAPHLLKGDVCGEGGSAAERIQRLPCQAAPLPSLLLQAGHHLQQAVPPKRLVDRWQRLHQA
mmetsp:Transcript_16955/g.43471  ORF Transcript_16955/g.43471 Transcript_16955/m.43471 type:complete len:210 (-) Transcript_16955:1089-1718(-)